MTKEEREKAVFTAIMVAVVLVVNLATINAVHDVYDWMSVTDQRLEAIEVQLDGLYGLNYPEFPDSSPPK